MPFSDNPLPIERKPTPRQPITADAWLGVLCVSGLSFLIVFGARLLPKTPERPQSSVVAGAAQSRELRVARVTPSGQRYSEPLPGRVVLVGSPLATSQAVTPGDSLLQIADPDAGVFVVADVFESDLGTVRVGAPARISLLSAPHETLESRVDMVADVVGLLPDENVVEQRGYLLDSQSKELL